MLRYLKCSALCCLLFICFVISSTGCVHLSPEQERVLYFSREYLSTEEVYQNEVVGRFSPFPFHLFKNERMIITGEEHGVYDFELGEFQPQTDGQISFQKFVSYAVLSEDQVTTATDFSMLWEKVPKSESIHWKKRSDWHLVSYPIWGLPRDLIDVPFTQMRRWDFDTHKDFYMIAPRGKYEEYAMLEYLEIAGMIIGGVGVPVLIAATVTPLWVSVPLAVLAVIPGTIGGFAAGAGINEFLPDSLNWLARNVQTPLLRMNVDSEDFFPNWKFGVHEPVLSEHSGSYEWRVKKNDGFLVFQIY